MQVSIVPLLHVLEHPHGTFDGSLCTNHVATGVTATARALAARSQQWPAGPLLRSGCEPTSRHAHGNSCLLCSKLASADPGCFANLQSTLHRVDDGLARSGLDIDAYLPRPSYSIALGRAPPVALADPSRC